MKIKRNTNVLPEFLDWAKSQLGIKFETYKRKARFELTNVQETGKIEVIPDSTNKPYNITASDATKALKVYKEKCNLEFNYDIFKSDGLTKNKGQGYLFGLIFAFANRRNSIAEQPKSGQTSKINSASPLNEVEEGKRRLREIEVISRNPGLRVKVLERDNYRCVACSDDLSSKYGFAFQSAIECHHTIPISKGKRITSINDLQTLCANCHRVIHSSSEAMTIEELKAIVSKSTRT